VSTIRVVSYNIHKGRSATGARESLDELRLSLYNLAPDLLFLQEVQGRNEREATLDAQHESLAAVMGMYTAYGCNAMRQHTDHGNALLSRYPILQYENQDVSDHRLEQRGLLHAVVEIDDRQVHCLVVHLGLFAGGRERQAQALVNRIKSVVPAHEPLIIAGDFNDWQNRLSPVLIRELDLYEVFSFAHQIPVPKTFRHRALRWWQPAATPNQQNKIPELGVGRGARITPPPRTFPSVFPWFRLDRIYQRGFAVRTARVLQGNPWRQISDHAPLFTELELP